MVTGAVRCIRTLNAFYATYSFNPQSALLVHLSRAYQQKSMSSLRTSSVVKMLDSNPKRLPTDKLESVEYFGFVDSSLNFDEYRRKTNSLLNKKDAHINRLQERLNSCLQQNSNSDASTLHVVVAERDSLRSKLHQLELAYAEEKELWMLEFEKLRRPMDLCLMEYSDNKEHVSVHCQTIPQEYELSSTCQTCSALGDVSKYSEQCRREAEAQLANAEAKAENQMAANKHLVSELATMKNVNAQLNDAIKSLNDEIRSLNVELTSKKQPSDDDDDQMGKSRRLHVENDELKRRLFEANEYFESMDVEAEQQITTLVNQLDEMHEMLEEQKRDFAVLGNELASKCQECDALQQKSKTYEVQIARQQDVVESLREEFDKQKDKTREAAKERDDLLLRNASLTHELDFVEKRSQKEREDIHQQLTLAGRELDEYKEKLSMQRQSENDAHASLILLGDRVSELDEALKRKQADVDELHLRLATVKKLLRKNVAKSKSQYDLSISSGSDRYQLTNPISKKPRTNDGYVQVAQDVDGERVARALGSLLRLSTDEEQMVRNYFRQKNAQAVQM